MNVNSGTRFVVLTSQRSGSAWLISILNSLDDTTAYGELFLPRRRVSGEKKWDSDFAYPRFIETEPDSLAPRPFSVFSYLDILYRTPGVVGFKLMYGQLRLYPEILAYLIRHHVSVVHLVRRNHLNVVISHAIRAKTGQAHLLSYQPRPDVIRIELDLTTLESKLKKLRRQQMIARKLLRWCGLPHIELAYEDICNDQSHFSLIWDFLPVNPEGRIAKSDLVRIRRRGHAEVISNYEGVKAALAGSAFAELVE